MLAQVLHRAGRQNKVCLMVYFKFALLKRPTTTNKTPTEHNKTEQQLEHLDLNSL